MLRALDAIASYVAGMDEDAFSAQRVVVDAVAMNLIVIGEGANRLSPTLKAQVAAPWTEIVGLRHRLAHEYFGMRIDRLWTTASIKAPELRTLVGAWLEAR